MMRHEPYGWSRLAVLLALAAGALVIASGKSVTVSAGSEACSLPVEGPWQVRLRDRQ